MRLLFSILLLLLFLQPADLSGQKTNRKNTITGKVTDGTGKPVAGAVIFIDKVKTESITDDQGNYRVKVKPDATEILVFTLLNGAGEALINGRTVIDFKLTGVDKENDQAKTEGPVDVVNTGYGSMEKKNATTQTNIIDGRDPSFASARNIYDMIRGRFPGVEVSGTSIKVMGSSSLNVSTEPLFVVDGVIVRTIDDVVPQTVKSIEVLKGPAASVYGTRGANGVILITRLTGKD